jgi:cell volume regulation protein A
VEPQTSAILLAVLGLLLGVSVLLSGAAGRLRIPLALLYLGLGMLAGVEGLGRIHLTDYAFAFRLGTASLVLILFDGGLNTSLGAIRRAVRPAAVLATAGVAGTAAVVAFGAHLLGFPWGAALLLGAVVSSTDAAAVFSVLRGSRVELSRRVATTLELESGLNDPLAVLLTVLLTEAELAGGRPSWAALALQVPVELAVGFAGGLAVGYGGRRLLRKLRPSAHGLIPVFTTALAFLAYGVPTLLHGSGFLAVYVAAVVLGNGALPDGNRLRSVHDALAWFAQVIMFLVLGLLSAPSRLLQVGAVGVALGALLAFVARPAVVLLCLLPFRYPFREAAYIGWVGLRGAVPIILATFPVLAGVPDAQTIFDVVFFVVVVNALVPGVTVKWATRLCRVEVKAPPPPRAMVEIHSTEELHGELLSFYIEPASVVAGARIVDLPFPDAASVMLVVRGRELVAPRGDTELRPGDHVYVVCAPGDKSLVLLLFGRPEED